MKRGVMVLMAVLGGNVEPCPVFYHFKSLFLFSLFSAAAFGWEGRRTGGGIGFWGDRE